MPRLTYRGWFRFVHWSGPAQGWLLAPASWQMSGVRKFSSHFYITSFLLGDGFRFDFLCFCSSLKCQLRCFCLDQRGDRRARSYLTYWLEFRTQVWIVFRALCWHVVRDKGRKAIDSVHAFFCLPKDRQSTARSLIINQEFLREGDLIMEL